MRDLSKMDASKAFPAAQWGERAAEFFAGETLPPAAPPASAALVFALDGDEFVLADIAGRGWCIPGGRLERGESPEQAARRETREEAGATLGPLRLLGWYVLTDEADGSQSSVPVYLARVADYAERPAGFESRGVCKTPYDAIPLRYYLWDALIAAVFAFAWATACADK